MLKEKSFSFEFDLKKYYPTLFNQLSEFKQEKMYESIFFKYNVIDKSEYLSSNEKLRKNESGCQGSFVPYSEIYVRKFIIWIVAIVIIAVVIIAVIIIAVVIIVVIAVVGFEAFVRVFY